MKISFSSKYTNLKYLIAFVLLLFTSCDGPKDELHKKINIGLRNDNKIDEVEWNEYTSYIIENKENFPELVVDDNKVDLYKLTTLILDIANKRRDPVEPEIFSPQSTKAEYSKPVVNFFIENSASMDGYVSKTTEFEAALSNLMILVQYHFNKENLNVNFINTEIYPSQINEVKDFVEALEPDKAPYKIGDRSVSKLNEILEMILDSTSQESISLFISDCIYSLESNKETESALEFQKGLTQGAFLEKSKEFDISTIVLKMNSKFNGNYWNKENNSEFLKNIYRPYYIWIIGSDNQIENFIKKVKFKSLKGYERSYFLSNFTKTKNPYYEVLRETNKQGKFRPADKNEKVLRSISAVEYENGRLQFAVAIDLSNIPVDDSYLTNISNYNVTEGFILESVEEIDKNKLTQRDNVKVSNSPATHVATISKSNNYPLQDLKISLLNKIPLWVYESTSMDDRDITKSGELSKTFGLSYLIEGVAEAYKTQKPDQNSYFTIVITVKK